MIMDAPWFVPNAIIWRELHTPIVKEEIHCYNCQYSARLSAHPNGLVVIPMSQPERIRLYEENYDIRRDTE
jgi:hypothetical protein